MKILPTTQTSNAISKNPSFQKGLNQDIVNWAKKINPNEVEQMLQSKGLTAHFGGVQSVAFSCLATVKIFEALNLEIPQNFLFCSFPAGYSNTLGLYNSESDIVAINANVKEFYDLNHQNYLEEHQSAFHPKTKHFLHTYIHEFMHAAHLKNIIKKHGEERGRQIYMDFSDKPTSNYLVQPLNNLISQAVTGDFYKIFESFFTPNNGFYAKTNLKEYISEKFSSIVETDLTPSLEPSPNSLGAYTRDLQYDSIDVILTRLNQSKKSASGFFGSMKERLKYTAAITALLQLCVSKYDGDIWNGYVDRIEKMKDLIVDKDRKPW